MINYFKLSLAATYWLCRFLILPFTLGDMLRTVYLDHDGNPTVSLSVFFVHSIALIFVCVFSKDLEIEDSPEK